LTDSAVAAVWFPVHAEDRLRKPVASGIKHPGTEAADCGKTDDQRLTAGTVLETQTGVTWGQAGFPALFSAVVLASRGARTATGLQQASSPVLA